MKRKWEKGLASVFAVAGIIVVGCSTARRGEPFIAVSLDEPELVAGRQVFQTHCSHCHPGGEGGLGPAISNKPLPDFLIRFQVRNGLGVMPAFSEGEISETEMDDLLAYLAELKRRR